MKRRALVTGAAAGLAAGIAPAMASAGFEHVSITYRTTSPDATLQAIRERGASADATRVDFLDDAPVAAAALAALVKASGPFDTLVHAVGPLVVRRFERTNLEDYREMFDGNVRSAILCAHAVLPAMRAQGFGRIVYFGMNGSGQTQPFRGFSLYQAAKSAVVAFARSLAVEEAPHGITVNVIEPGDIRIKGIDRAQARTMVGGTPRGRPGSFEDVADVVNFLVAADRDFVTGAVIAVTGGLMGAAERNATDQ